MSIWVCDLFYKTGLFGKCTGVRDAHDRYANQEISYLLQRVETYNGLVILASNLRENIDDAFLRRFQSMIHFPLPRPGERLRLWQNAIPPPVALDQEVDLKLIADRYEVSGAGIMNIVHYCCLETMARQRQTLSLDLLTKGVQRELQKLGKSG